MSKLHVMTLRWSLINLIWEIRTDRLEDCVKMLQNKPTEANYFMVEGQRLHEEFEAETLKTKRVPKIFNRPDWDYETIPEVEFDFMLLPWLRIKSVMDAAIPELNLIIDYKTGISENSTITRYKKSPQWLLYLICANALKLEGGQYDYFEFAHIKKTSVISNKSDARFMRFHYDLEEAEDFLRHLVKQSIKIRSYCDSIGEEWWRLNE